MNATTEQNAPDGIAAEASPPPLGFTLVLWMGALSVVLWSMTALFRRRVGPVTTREPEDPGDDTEPS